MVNISSAFKAIISIAYSHRVFNEYTLALRRQCGDEVNTIQYKTCFTVPQTGVFEQGIDQKISGSTPCLAPQPVKSNPFRQPALRIRALGATPAHWPETHPLDCVYESPSEQRKIMNNL